MALKFNLEVTQQIQPDCREVIARGLREFNRLHLGEYQWVDFDVYARNNEGLVIGGLIGDIALGWLSIHALWVADAHRAAGLGSEILRVAEAEAVKAGCRAAVLDTLGFQAPRFYEKRGYVRVGVIDNYRGGVQRIFMQKVFTSTARLNH